MNNNKINLIMISLHLIHLKNKRKNNKRIFQTDISRRVKMKNMILIKNLHFTNMKININNLINTHIHTSMMIVIKINN